MSKPGTNAVLYEVTPQGVALVTLDHFPVNTLTNAVQLGLEDAADKIAAAGGAIKAVVVRGAGTRALCAGADLVDLNKQHERYPKRAFMEHFEHLNVPVVAAVQGFTLGGGLELALGCHYRVMSSNAVIGLPEVNIGLLPGGQGTQRLPRLIGAQPALELMLSGGHVPAKKALEWGVADALFAPEELNARAEQFALEQASKNPTNAGRRISEVTELPGGRPDASFYAKQRALMAAKRKNQPAAQLIVDCVEAAASQPFAEGVATEGRLFRQILGGPEAMALQHMFFSERAAGKVPGLKEKPAPVRKVALIGAGLMAGGIAMGFAEAGMDVVMLDREQQFLDKGMAVIKANYARSVERKSKSQAVVDKCLARFSTTTSYEDLHDVDLVVEAVFEMMELKKEIFAKLDKVCKPSCLLATNTSFLSIDEIASATQRPESVIGMHYFSPANVMPLLEVVRGAKTSARTIATAMATGTRVGKWTVLVGNCHGFLANRLMALYSGQARRLLMEGASLEAVDGAATDYGMPLGPLQLRDLTGDVGFEARKKQGIVDPEKSMDDWLSVNGRQGMKSGAGYYDYSKDRKRSSSPEVAARIEQIRKNLGSTPRAVPTEEIFQRLFLPIINEGFRTLEEGIVSRPADVDVALCHGYNWPRVSGGPMHWADGYGLPKVLAALQEYSAKFPRDTIFKPSQLLQDCVKANMTLTQYWAKNSAKYVAKL